MADQRLRNRPRSLMDLLTMWPLLSPYASKLTSILLFFTMFQQLFPRPLQYYLAIAVRLFWKKPKSSKLTLVFRENDGMSSNQMFNAAEAFLCSKINDSNRLRVTKNVKQEHVTVKFEKSEVIKDSFQGISLAWDYVIQPPKQKSTGNNGGGNPAEKKYIELKFEKRYKETIINSYLPWIIKKSKELEDQKKSVKLHNLQWRSHCYDRPSNESVNLDHPSTFDTLAMDPKMKKAIIDDLDLFLKRREFYRKVGKAWKRGYLLYGPPGTGKSSLIAAMANYLKFDIYDLQLNAVDSDSCLKKLILSTSNRSIIVIEDIDCSEKSHDREKTTPPIPVKPQRNSKFTLSGLLNFIDGLWSCCGDERIIIFTTNHKEKLDPALLRPGRMDVHIHMSYLTFDGFKILAANYLNIQYHRRFTEIEELIKGINVTPAEVAEELMKSDDQEVVLEGLVGFLKSKKIEKDKAKEATRLKSKKIEKDKAKEATRDGEDKVLEAEKVEKEEKNIS